MIRRALVLLAIATTASAQQGFTTAFPPEEFAARRAKIMSSIGDGVAILQGTTERRGESPLRQSNQFFYLTGVTEPRAMLIVDGKTKRSTLFIAKRTDQRQRMIGPYLDVGDSSAKATRRDRSARFVRDGGRTSRRGESQDLHAVPPRSTRQRVSR